MTCDSSLQNDLQTGSILMYISIAVKVVAAGLFASIFIQNKAKDYNIEEYLRTRIKPAVVFLFIAAILDIPAFVHVDAPLQNDDESDDAYERELNDAHNLSIASLVFAGISIIAVLICARVILSDTLKTGDLMFFTGLLVVHGILVIAAVAMVADNRAKWFGCDA